MRYILVIIVGLTALITKASHLAGGELTYTYISGKTYQINVTLYRDCNDCKLGGTGGGTSNTNCTELEEVYLRTINASCGNKTIGAVSLTKTGYENITPICTTSKSKCELNSDYPYGFEAHYYTGTVNFNNYTTYSGCMLQIFFHKSERSKDITNLSSEEDDLYNFALINPWIENTSSPKFNEPPKLLFNLYQATYSNDGVIANTGDSLAFKWGIPYSNYNSAISYKSGHNAYNFATTYCPGGGTCSANPTADIPEGLYLNETTGDFVFTPVGNNEISTRVLEIEQWRKISGSFQLAGKIRRDVLVIISASNENNPPKVDLADEYFVCVGQKFELPIGVLDKPYNQNGIEQKQDSSFIDIISSLSGLKIEKTITSQAPYLKSTLVYEPVSGDEGTYFIQIKATDNYCPEIGTTYKTVQLVVKSAPDFSYQIEDEFCGNNRLTLNSNREGTFDINVKTEDSLNVFTLINSSKSESFQYLKNENLEIEVFFTDEYGCTVSKNSTFLNKGSSNITKANIAGSTKVCKNNDLKLKLEHSELTINQPKWYNNSTELGNSLELNSNPFNGTLAVEYVLQKNELECPIKDSLSIELLEITPITIEDPKPICYLQSFNLNELKPSPETGIWSSNETLVGNNLKLTNIGNRDSFVNLTYSFTNQVGCTSVKALEIPILKSPIIKLSNEAICGDKFEFRLKNAIELPYNPDIENITWEILNNPDALISSPFAAIDIPEYGTGVYSIEATNTYVNGCITRDTGIITVDEGLTLKTNGKTSICQQWEAINLENYLELNATGGGWNSFSAGDLLNQRLFTPSACGEFDFLYTYDKNGCFDELNLSLNVVCKPKFDISLPGAICSDNESINLPENGTWSGQGVQDNLFDPSAILGWVYLRNVKTVEECVFDTFIPLEVIKPLQLNIGALPTKLCQGEELEFEINATDLDNLSIESCGNYNILSNNNLLYTPANCDLKNEKIKLRIIQNTPALCPLVQKDIEVPYYKIPTITVPNANKACWPYTANHTIDTLNEDLNSISYFIKSQNASSSKTSNKISYSFPSPGNYNLEVMTTNNKGCKNLQLFENQYILHPKPNANFTAGNKHELSLSERDVYFDNKSTISAGELNYNWYWKKGNQTKVFSDYRNPYYTFPADTGKFEVCLIAKSDENCSDTFIKNVWIVPDILVFIPNAFTPDNRGPIENAKFNIVTSNVESFHIQIFNKWGQMVFESFDIANSWDGNFLGKFCQTGVYVYSIKMTNESGLDYQYQGTVNLVR